MANGKILKTGKNEYENFYFTHKHSALGHAKKFQTRLNNRKTVMPACTRIDIHNPSS